MVNPLNSASTFFPSPIVMIIWLFILSVPLCQSF